MKHIKTLFLYLLVSLFIIFLTSSFTAQAYIDDAESVDITGKTAAIALNQKKIKKADAKVDTTTDDTSDTNGEVSNTNTTQQSTTKNYSKTYKQGDKKDAIKPYQRKLKQLGYLPSNAKVDGAFGNMTNKAIKKFQKNENLPVTGKLDADTMKKLDEME